MKHKSYLNHKDQITPFLMIPNGDICQYIAVKEL